MCADSFFCRLFTVLMMPTTTDAKKLDKIRDMEELVLWYANALSPNEGFAGVLKPDYLGFHHNSYYASAYTPHAIHCGALIEFLLSGTPFKLSKNELVTGESKVGTKKKSHCVPTPLQRLLLSYVLACKRRRLCDHIVSQGKCEATGGERHLLVGFLSTLIFRPCKIV